MMARQRRRQPSDDDGNQEQPPVLGDGSFLRQPGGSWHPDQPAIEAALERAEIAKLELMPSGSNYVFAALLVDEAGGHTAAVYKPRKGESPLWDYPSGTLYKRERAAYLLSQALGWRIVPPTVVREGPHGIGSVQLYIEHRPRSHFFTMRESKQDAFRAFAAFDALANNGDRKGGHCLDAVDGAVWGIDHGLTFHEEDKLRTVIWDFTGEPVPETLLGDVRQLLARLQRHDDCLGDLDDMLHRDERRALVDRAERLLSSGRFPDPPSWRPVPWPAI